MKNIIKLRHWIVKIYANLRRRKPDKKPITLIVDATGVGPGGLSHVLRNVIVGLNQYEKISIILLGCPNELFGQFSNVQVSKRKTNYRVIHILQTSFKLILLRFRKHAVLYTLSPTISTLAWIGKPNLSQVNDLQSFLPGFRISIFTRLYRRATYFMTFRLSSVVITASDATSQLFSTKYPITKKIVVIPWSGEIIASSQSISFRETFDFLIINHSLHKNADYIFGLLSDLQFRGTRIAVLGGHIKKETKDQLDKFGIHFKIFTFVVEEEFLELIKHSNTIVMNSDFGTEGFGLPVAQAIYYGKRVVTSNDPALVDTGKNYASVLNRNEMQDRNLMMSHLKMDISQSTTEASIYQIRSWTNVCSDLFNEIKKISF